MSSTTPQSINEIFGLYTIAKNAKGYAIVTLFGIAFAKYQYHGDTPHSELLFITVLNLKTWNSGHSQKSQK